MSFTRDTSPDGDSRPLTYIYKVVDGVPIHLDVYPPESAWRGTSIPNGKLYANESPCIPAVLYWHGGGLNVGDRTSWFPNWLKKRISAAGYVFISADYRLIPPSTAHDVLEDIKDVHSFVSERLNTLLSQESANNPDLVPFCVDPNAIAVSGTSAGGLCAIYAAMHVSPKPKAVVAMYPMGGDFLTPYALVPKTSPFLKGRPILDTEPFSDFLYPACKDLPVVSGSPLIYDPPTAPIPGYPANPRMLLSRLFAQMGLTVDYVTGEHDPSLSATLRAALGSEKNNAAHSNGSSEFDAVNERLKELIPEKHLPLFPQFGIKPDLPPTYMAHGALDTAVYVNESKYLHRLMKEAGIDARLDVIDGVEHSFDYAEDAEDRYGSGLFDNIAKFLKEHLEKARAH